MKRAMGIIAGALIFGLIAGGTMTGVNMVANRAMIQKQVQNVEGTEAQTEQSTENGTEKEVASSMTYAPEGIDVSKIADEALPSVVAITNMVLYQQYGYSMLGPYQTEQEVPASGSGIIVGKTDNELLIATNNHVVEDSTSLSVTFVDNQTVDAYIKGTDSTVDLAVIAIKLSDVPQETMDAIKVASLGNSDDVKVGEGVVAIGNALGYGQSVTTGIISAKDRSIQTEEGTEENLLQTDAAINPGNSGGALLNLQGEVIGINVAKAAKMEVEGMGYAIPSNKAADVIKQLSTSRTKDQEVPENEQGYLGIMVQTIDSQTAQLYDMPEGVFIYQYSDDNSAAKASGLLEKDIITKFDGQSVKTKTDLSSVMRFYRSGDTVNITVQRLQNGAYQEIEIPVTLGAKPADQIQQNQEQQTSAEQQPSQQDPNQQGSSLWDEFRNFLEQQR